MTLIDVLDFLEEKVDCPNWYAGKRSDTAEDTYGKFLKQFGGGLIK